MFNFRRAFPSGVHLNLLATTSSAGSTIPSEQKADLNAAPVVVDDSDAPSQEEEWFDSQRKHSERNAPHSVDSQSQDSVGQSANVDSPSSYDSDIVLNTWNPVPGEYKSVEGEHATTTTPPQHPTVDHGPQIADEPRTRVRTRKSTSSFPTFLQKLAEASKQTEPLPDTPTSSNPSTSPPLQTSPTQISPRDADDENFATRRRRNKRTNNSFPILGPIVEYDPMEVNATTTSSSSSGPSFNLVSTSEFAKKMEEAGRLRRLQSQSLAGTPPVTSTTPPPPPVPPKLPNTHLDHDKAPSISDNKSEIELEPDPKTEEKATSANDLDDVPELIERSEIERQKARDEELDDLHEALQRALTELDDAREQNFRLFSQYNEEKQHLTQQLKANIEEADTLRRENSVLQTKYHYLRKQVMNSEAEFKALKKDKNGWQAQLDAMHERVSFADKQIRCLDGITRTKVEAKMEGAFGPTRRSQKAVTKDPSAEVVNAVNGLNEEIMQAASLLVENLEKVRTPVPPTALSRAKTIFGKQMIRLLQAQAADKSSEFKILLTQGALEAFMVHWSMSIIEALYPVRQSFADLLVDLSSKASSSKHSVALNAKVECGKVKIIDTTPNAVVHFPEWVADILKDLGLVLSLSGLRMKVNRTAVFTSKFFIVVNMAYNVRMALAERDLNGGIEACVESGDQPFQPKWMDEAYVSNRNKSSSSMEAEYIASTSAIGLRRTTTDQDKIMVLKPKVVLVRVLEESP